MIIHEFRRPMRTPIQKQLSFAAIVAVAIVAALCFAPRFVERIASAQTTPTPTTTPAPAAFDQKAALAKLREQIKGHEKDPAPAVFKNIKVLTGTTAER